MLQVPEKGDGSQEPLAPRRGPGRDEWETHKDVIEMLYCERELPLKDVARIMQQDYGFRGTTRMYKVRFKQWGFRKNLTKAETIDVWDQASSGPAQLPVVRGRRIGPKRLRDQVESFNRRTSFDRSCTAAPVYLRSPDSLHVLDGALYQIRRYTEGHLARNQWDLTTIFSWNDESLNWGVVLREAAYQLSAEGDAVMGLRLLDGACAQFRDVARKQQPLLLWNLLVSTTEIMSSAADVRVVASLTAFMASMCTVELGPSHPLTMLCAGLRAMDRMQMRAAVASFLGAQLDLLSQRARGEDVLGVFMRMITSQWLSDMGMILDFSLSEMISDVSDELRGGKDIKASNFGLGVAWGTILLTERLINAGRFVEADASLECVQRCADDLDRPDELLTQYTKLKAFVQEQWIKPEHVESQEVPGGGDITKAPTWQSRASQLEKTDSNTELRHVLNGLEALSIYRGAWPVR
ncbi:hypothetical protein KJ359_002898 [Pestalotiopsis sp. 9143b]|nr:hypothetical protein KJ359_002898 [Pestalotiopsis sp. 9143b]